MRRAFAQGVLTLAGWTAIFAVLPPFFSNAEVGVILAILALAEVFAALMASGPSGRKMLERILLSWLSLCGGLIGLLYFDQLPIFENHPAAILSLLGATLAIALIRFVLTASVLQAMTLWLATARLSIVALGLHLMKQFEELSVAVTLATCVLFLALVLLLVLRLQNNAPPAGARAERLPLPQLFAKNADLLVMPLILPAPLALPYLIAKGASLVLPSFVFAFESSIQPRLKEAIANKDAALFVATAARINLGVLLIGGGLAVGVLSLLPTLAEAQIFDMAALRPVLLWVLLAESAPALFGATAVLLRSTGFSNLHNGLNTIGAVLIPALGCFVIDPDPLVLAQLYAGVQLAICGVGAGVLAWKTGVFPGLTALMFKQIRIF